jgi:hypothetical protein
MKNHHVTIAFFGLLLLLLPFAVHGQEAGETQPTSSAASCITDPSLRPAIQLDQKVTALHIRMPSYWCQGTIPNDFVFTIEPTNTTTTMTNIYTLPRLHSTLLQANQTTDNTNGNTTNTTTTTTTFVSIVSQNTVFGPPGQFGVVIQVPANDLQTVILERSFYFDRNSVKLRIRPGFTALQRIVCQTLEPFQDNQAIELEADISTSTSPVTIDVLHHGTYHVIGNVNVLNVIPSSSDHTNTVAMQIKGNVNSGNITRPGMYSIFGNITGPLTVDSTKPSLDQKDTSNSNADAQGAAVVITTSSCDSVTLLEGQRLGDDDDTCNTVSTGTLTNMMLMNPSFFHSTVHF